MATKHELPTFYDNSTQCCFVPRRGLGQVLHNFFRPYVGQPSGFARCVVVAAGEMVEAVVATGQGASS